MFFPIPKIRYTDPKPYTTDHDTHRSGPLPIPILLAFPIRCVDQEKCVTRPLCILLSDTRKHKYIRRNRER